MNGSSRADIKDRNFRNELFGPMRMFDVKMPTRNIREELHDSDDNLCQKPVEKSSFVFQQRRKNAAAARLLRTKTLRSKNKPPSKTELITAALTLETCNPVTAA